MGLFGKKKKEELPLPPPPPRPVPERPTGDIEPIRPQEDSYELPPLPDLPEETYSEPPYPKPAEFPEPRFEAPKFPEPEHSFPEPRFAEFEEQSYPERRFESPVREEEVIEPPRRVLPSKSFVSVQDYKRIIGESNLVRDKVMEAESLIRELKDIKDNEDKLFQKWREHAEQIEKKLSYVDQVLSKAQR